MVNVHDVLTWFRYGTSDLRLNVLCRLLDCCIPFELHFLSTYLQELLLSTMLSCKHTDIQYSNLNDLCEITKSSSRRQLCILLTNLKSMDKLQAHNIYNILIKYDFNEFFSRVFSLEEEIVDEILLLFTLASNHPAMTFTQRSFLHERLTQLKETIEKSFECCLTSDEEEFCCSWFNNVECKMKKKKDDIFQSDVLKEEQKASNYQSPEVMKKFDKTVHIKDLRVIKAQEGSFDDKHEYVFEVSWSNGHVIKIHRSYGELFDFQCKLRRRHTKDSGNLTKRRVIPYLPSRKPLKFCKAKEILPDITDYVREFARLPEKILHSEWVENFFRDGNECSYDERTRCSIKKNPEISAQKTAPASKDQDEKRKKNTSVSSDTMNLLMERKCRAFRKDERHDKRVMVNRKCAGMINKTTVELETCQSTAAADSPSRLAASSLSNATINMSIAIAASASAKTATKTSLPVKFNKQSTRNKSSTLLETPITNIFSVTNSIPSSKQSTYSKENRYCANSEVLTMNNDSSIASPNNISPPQIQHFDLTMVTDVTTCQRRAYERTQFGKLFESITNKEKRNSDMNKIWNKEKSNLKTSMHVLTSSQKRTINGFTRNNIASNGVLIVANDAIDQNDKNMRAGRGIVDKTIIDKNSNYLFHIGVPQHAESCSNYCNVSDDKETNMMYSRPPRCFCKQYCHACGECGHCGHHCSEFNTPEKSLTT